MERKQVDAILSDSSGLDVPGILKHKQQKVHIDNILAYLLLNVNMSTNCFIKVS
jgi:hypothetical protein